MFTNYTSTYNDHGIQHHQYFRSTLGLSRMVNFNKLSMHRYLKYNHQTYPSMGQAEFSTIFHTHMIKEIL